MTMNNRINNSDTEYGIDSRYICETERKKDGASLMKARLDRIKNLSKDQIENAKKLQHKLKMEDDSKNPVSDNH